MIYSTNMTNSQWQAIKDLLPAKTWKRKRKHSIRAIINAIFYVTKGGIPWRMMPNDLPDWRLVYRAGGPILLLPVDPARSGSANPR